MWTVITQIVCFVAFFYVAASAISENWSQFRGPHASGIVVEGELPVTWGPDNQVLWKVAIPGAGWSQPAVWGDRIFITTAQADKQLKPEIKKIRIGAGVQSERQLDYHWKVLCLDAANGNIIWERTAHDGHPTIPLNVSNTYASESPVTDGERVVAYFGMTGVYCYDFKGNELWGRELGTHQMMFDWGTGSSPILFDNKVFIQCDNEEASFLVALNKTTGHDVWRINRDEKSNWSTPYIWKNKIRTELITAGGGQMRSYDPKSGQLLWSMRGSGRTATTPVGDADLLYLDSYDRVSGGGGAFVAIRPGASGDISPQPDETSNKHVAWSVAINGYRASSPVLCRDCLYILEEFVGVVRCLDAKTGKEHYRKRLPGAAGFTASALAHRDRVYCLDQTGRTHIIEAGPEFKIIAHNKLGEGMYWASPAIAGNHILIRSVDHLYAIGQK